MSDINIYLPLIPTFEQIKDLINSFYQKYLYKKKNTRLDVTHALTELSSLSIYDIQYSYCNIETNEFLNKINYAYNKISKALTNYIDDEVLYIKHNKDSWVMEFYSFRKEYNKIVAAFNANNCTDLQKEEFVNYLSEFYDYIYNVFEKKYKHIF